MTIYNVLTGICELVEADTPEQAVALVHGALSNAGFNVYPEVGSRSVESQLLPDAFESDDQTEEPSLRADARNAQQSLPVPTLPEHDTSRSGIDAPANESGGDY